MDIMKLKMVSQFWKTRSLILWQIYLSCFRRIKGHIMVKVNNLTCLSTISSARISFMVHSPPIINEISLRTIRKQGEIRVPRGASGLFEYCRPAGSFSLGRFSAPPPPSTSPLVAGRFLCCVLLDCQQMLADKWKLCLSFPIRRFHLQSQSCKLVERKNRKCLSRGILYDYHSTL